MKTIVAAIVAGMCALTLSQSAQKTSMPQTTAMTYEHLASAIIEIRAAEDGLVKTILTDYWATACHELDQAADSAGTDRSKHLEAAAGAIAYIANEGDKAVQAVRQRLLKAGHHHHTDAETKDDYVFVDSNGKKAFLALATRVSQMGPTTGADQIRAVSGELTTLFERCTTGK